MWSQCLRVAGLKSGSVWDVGAGSFPVHVLCFSGKRKIWLHFKTRVRGADRQKSLVRMQLDLGGKQEQEQEHGPGHSHIRGGMHVGGLPTLRNKYSLSCLTG